MPTALRCRGPWASFLWARRAATEGKRRSQSDSGQGICSSPEEHPSVGDSSSSSFIFLALTPSSASSIVLRRLLPQYALFAYFAWCSWSASSDWKLLLHFVHRCASRSRAISAARTCTSVRWLRSRATVENKMPQSLQMYFRTTHSCRL